ncbi:MAG: hypothetical protein ABWW69_01770 [Pyrodictiaceae archaeon]
MRVFRTLVQLIRGGRLRRKSNGIDTIIMLPEPLLRELEAMGGIDGEAEAIRRAKRLPPLPPMPRL